MAPGPAFGIASTRAKKAAARANGGCAVIASVLVTAMLTGCASFSRDSGMGAVSSIAATEVGKEARKIDDENAAAASRARVRRLLASTLSADAGFRLRF